MLDLISLIFIHSLLFGPLTIIVTYTCTFFIKTDEMIMAFSDKFSPCRKVVRKKNVRQNWETLHWYRFKKTEISHHNFKQSKYHMQMFPCSHSYFPYAWIGYCKRFPSRLDIFYNKSPGNPFIWSITFNYVLV